MIPYRYMTVPGSRITHPLPRRESSWQITSEALQGYLRKLPIVTIGLIGAGLYRKATTLPESNVLI